MRSLLLLVCLAPCAWGQSFSYPDFSSVAGLALNGAAQTFNNRLRITPATTGQAGSFFRAQPTRVTADFTCTFTFRITNPVLGGGDGLAFVVQASAAGSAALGDAGSGMGYRGLDNCLVVEFDTFAPGPGDPDGNHVSIHSAGSGINTDCEALSLGLATVPVDMSDGAVHTAVVRARAGRLAVFVDDLLNPLIDIPYDFVAGGAYSGGAPVGGLALLGGDAAFVGFSAATGSARENHDVLAWDWCDDALGVNYCGPPTSNSTGLPGRLVATGSPLLVDNDVQFTVDQLPPNRFGYFLMGAAQGFQVVGQGFLCLAPPFVRFAQSILDAGPSGVMLFAPDLANLPAGTLIAVGETWNFQCWYRDVNPASTSNLSDAVAITFR